MTDTLRSLEALTRRWMVETLDAWEGDRASGVDLSESEIAGYGIALDDLREALAGSASVPWVEETADGILSRERLTFSADERAQFLRMMIRGAIDVHERLQARSYGNYRPETLLAEPLAAFPSAATGPNLALGEAVKRYFEEHSSRSWSVKYESQARVSIQYFLDLVGADKPLRSISKEDVREYRDAMRKLPPRVGSTKKYKGMTLREILATADSAGLSEQTVDIYVNRDVGGLFRWALRMWYVDRNPVEGMMPKPRGRARDKRDAFSDSDLEAMFGGDFAELLKSARPEDYWFPLLLLHTGARNEEIAQLQLSDIEEVGGVLCLRIRDAKEAGQKLKTESSRRTLPVHPTVLELGFRGYVEGLRRGGQTRLFPGMKKTKMNGWHSATSRRFNRRLKELSISSAGKKNSYSFRHTLSTRLRDAHVPETTISELLGHSPQTQTGRTYIKDPEPAFLLNALAKFDSRRFLSKLLAGTKA